MAVKDMKSRWLKSKNKIFLSHLKQRAYNTSIEDINSLKMEYGNLIPVFIYDSFMKGSEDQEKFDNMSFLGPATTLEDQFLLLQNMHHTVMMPSAPLVMNHFNLHKGNLRRVQGELYGVPLDFIMWLDKVYDNGNSYCCDQISVVLHQEKGLSGHLVKNVLCYFGEVKNWTRPLSKTNTVQISPNVINSEFYENQRVYRAFRESPVKLPDPPASWYDDPNWEQMGFDGYGYGGM